MLETRWAQQNTLMILIIVGCAPKDACLSAREDENPLFRPKRVADRFRPITQIPVVTVAQAERSLNPTELVIGVTLHGESRAYPINMLTGPQREILNDVHGGRSIAATW